jgi:dTDP-4-amino-4,6-dideoxygalactose transaminase
MIATDFAANETIGDAWLSLKLLFQPWRWQKGKELEEIKKNLINQFQISNLKFKISLFLTGRAALNTILRSFDLPEGTEILVQAFTCEAVILPILANKLKPIYVDIEKTTFSMNPVDLEKKTTSKTKVLILQHSFSLTPIHRDQILSFVKQHHLLLIEDIAHGYSKQQFSIINFQFSNSIFLLSFGRSKAISSVFGGAIITNDKILAKKLADLEDSLALPSMFFIFRLLLYKPVAVLIKSTYDLYIGKMLHKLINWFNLLVPEITLNEKRGEYDQILNKAYPNALAILLYHQLNKFEQVQENRAKITAFYTKNLSKNFKFQISNFKLSLLRYPILVNNRDFILKKAAKKNVFLGKWYDQVVAPKSLDLKKVGYESGSCPVAEIICQKIINLPTNISQTEAERVLKTFNDYGN